MSKKQSKTGLKLSAQKIWNYFWHSGSWRRILFLIGFVLVLWTGAMYGAAQWYIHKHSSEPMVIGTTFIPDYAQSFGLDPKQTYEAILEDLNVKQVRLTSYWKNIEPSPGKYDFTMLDWEFTQAQAHNAKVSLAIGLRQPRWPECHEPNWVNIAGAENTWRPQLNKYMTAVIERYKDHPALGGYELENEFFMTVFGECKNFDRQRLVDEFNMVKLLDPSHQIIISRSNNWIGLPLGDPTPDKFGISVYKRVWDSTFTHRYFEYPLPAWFYASLAGWGELFTGKDMVIHELQAEAWTPNGKQIPEISVEEMYKSMSPERMKNRISYGQATGIKNIDLWGAEWWYWLKVDKNQPGIWNVVKDAVAKADAQNREHPCSGPSGYTTSHVAGIICD